MRIKSIRIENFRCFKDEIIEFDKYVCLIGSNGSGKSTILNALNVFFKNEKDSQTNLNQLVEEDFHHKNIKEPIKITLTFTDLSDTAKTDLSDYVRDEQLIVSAVATYDSDKGRAEVVHSGHRLGIAEFGRYFSAEKNGEKAAELQKLYLELKKDFSDLPNAKNKPDMADALRSYESVNKGKCVLLQSADQFYGINSTGKLSPFIQWVFVPASKDITEESEESKNTAFGQLLARTVRSKINFSEKINALKIEVQKQYKTILDDEKAALLGISNSLENRLKYWSRPDIKAKVCWDSNEEKAVKIEEPLAYPQFGERGFEGDLSRFGHGLQRSYMFALLQELNDSNDQSSATLVMAIEEPEIYQHPPQSRYLAEILRELSEKNSQILICSHSPLYVPGSDFEKVRLVREKGVPSSSFVSKFTYAELSKTLVDAGESLVKESGTMAKLYPILNPIINEMFFCNILILVEGVEDLAYITAQMLLSDNLEQFRASGCHVVPVGGKSKMIKPLAMANLLKIPVFIVFDADANVSKAEHVTKHKKDNRTLLNLAGHGAEHEWPSQTVWKENMVMWGTEIGDTVEKEIGSDFAKYSTLACARYDNVGDLKKNPLAIACMLEEAAKETKKSKSLGKLVSAIKDFAEKHKS
ncbi:MAG: ATP-dependent endonuclease [Elusimicrobia bacterium RIFOXYA12_FULL_51_18]|nr:MAG: ATP-dependent endonuclease [Elusimicrobia bacterium RIFOXYA12_FULL_51_18]OGS28396.1 MAG: ATP-dependent endonuclease [Elusimicrobia bacterium RIFOXYA2_FULL_53_38]